MTPSAPATIPRSEPQPDRTPFCGPIGHELPALYHETYLRVLPRDPHMFFSFWEIAPDAIETIKKTIPECAATASPLLRLYETASGAHEKPIGDIPVETDIRSRYFLVPESGRRYRLEYGFVSSGEFIPLCSSNEVAVPAARVQEPTARDSKGEWSDTKALIEFSARAMSIAAVPVDAVTDISAGYSLTSSYGLSADS